MSSLLALDLSSKTGWAFFVDGKLTEYGQLPKVNIEDFNVNSKPPPNKSSKYPKNIVSGAEQVAKDVMELVNKLTPDNIVIENSVKGRNRHTQRFIEYFHFTVTKILWGSNRSFSYLDPSEWRATLEMRLSVADKINNKEVKKGLKRGKIGKKHLSVRYVNETFGLKLKMKDNDISDGICLGAAWVLINEKE